MTVNRKYACANCTAVKIDNAAMSASSSGRMPNYISRLNTNVPTEDTQRCVDQILRLEEAGCEIIRCTVPNEEAALSISRIKKQIHIPLVADIHFDYKMAIAAIENGADKIRINPGNIGGRDKLEAVVRRLGK